MRIIRQQTIKNKQVKIQDYLDEALKEYVHLNDIFKHRNASIDTSAITSMTLPYKDLLSDTEIYTNELLIADLAIQQHKIEHYHSLSPSVSTSLPVEQLIEKLLREKQVKEYKVIAKNAIINHKSQLDKLTSAQAQSKPIHTEDVSNITSLNYRASEDKEDSSSNILVGIVTCIILIWLVFVILS